MSLSSRPPPKDTEPMGYRLDLDPDDDGDGEREVLDLDELLERLGYSRA